MELRLQHPSIRRLPTGYRSRRNRFEPIRIRYRKLLELERS